jgi:hypothetical protein
MQVQEVLQSVTQIEKEACLLFLNFQEQHHEPKPWRVVVLRRTGEAFFYKKKLTTSAHEKKTKESNNRFTNL